VGGGGCQAKEDSAQHLRVRLHYRPTDPDVSGDPLPETHKGGGGEQYIPPKAQPLKARSGYCPTRYIQEEAIIKWLDGIHCDLYRKCWVFDIDGAILQEAGVCGFSDGDAQGVQHWLCYRDDQQPTHTGDHRKQSDRHAYLKPRV